ncbi:Chaperone protein dnaJ 49 [Apostasia shenzhenica]|uniref:Chaperone protein dnaJ 49 n=1 Tax=Apostasia shenzhenica TaxID=1088818 RepID=A0A2I0B056_9ASPA|nr:Chaperone protein dnaJ 49 [Apostasia shenzhenica]
MATGSEKNGDFYAVLGLQKECSESDLRNAYKKLALRWHPDRCSASGKTEFVEEAKEKFQAIQEAYSVLSDSNKRFMYDVGIYDSDDGENDMGDFLDEMAQMMSQAKPNEDGQYSFKDLQQLFVDMFQPDLYGAAAGSSADFAGGGKRSSSELGSAANGNATLDGFEAASAGFCFGVSPFLLHKIANF